MGPLWALLGPFRHSWTLMGPFGSLWALYTPLGMGPDMFFFNDLLRNNLKQVLLLSITGVTLQVNHQDMKNFS